MDPLTLVTALLPMVSDGVRGLINKFTGGAGAKPANVKEAIDLMSAENERLRVVAELDKAEGVSTWVANVRALQRPAVAFTVLLLLSVMYVGNIGDEVDKANVLNLSSAVFSYLFGERLYLGLKGKK